MVQETRGWDEAKQQTFSQRKKEGSADYRYFPDPDLPKLKLSEIPEFSTENLKKELAGKLPWEKRDRLAKLGFLQVQDIEQLIDDVELSELFTQMEEVSKDTESLKIAANFILNDIAGNRKKDPAWQLPKAAFLTQVVEAFKEGVIAAPQAKSSILTGVMAQATDPTLIPAIAQKVIEANPTVAADYKAGKEAAMQFLVGQGMKESKGSANPAALKEAFVKLLS